MVSKSGEDGARERRGLTDREKCAIFSNLMAYRLGNRIGVLSLVVAVSAVACSVADGVTPLDASFDVTGPSPGADASGGSDAQDSGAAIVTFRIAHLAPDVGPVDVCYRVSSSEAFTGPLLAALLPPIADAGFDTLGAEAGSADAMSPASGLGFRSVTGFFHVRSAPSLEIAVVGASDGSCSTPRARSRITLDAGKRVTVALLGMAQADAGTIDELGLVPFVDDATPQASSARTRFIHAALGRPATAFSASALEGTVTIPLAANMEPRKTSTPAGTDPVVDTLGYHSSAAVGAASIQLIDLSDAGAPTWTSGSRGLKMLLASVHTAFVVSEPLSGLSIVWCDDASARPVSLGDVLTDCVVLHP